MGKKPNKKKKIRMTKSGLLRYRTAKHSAEGIQK